MNDFDKIDEYLYYEGYKAFELYTYNPVKDLSPGMGAQLVSGVSENDVCVNDKNVQAACDLAENVVDAYERDENELRACEYGENDQFFWGDLFDSVER